MGWDLMPASELEAEMSQENSIEARLAALEREVAELKQRLSGSGAPVAWWERIVGSMKDIPEFEEALRLGAEIRQADRPSPGS
jgi:hypothetical protein